MPQESKIVGSQYQSYIESELKGGTAYRKLSDTLKELGFNISHTALANYHKNHLDSEILKKDVEQIGYDGEVLEYDQELKDSDILQETVSKQIQIVAQKQAMHMRGECKFPTEEIKALKILKDAVKG